MPKPRIELREHPVETCPSCGGLRVGDVRPDDVGVEDEQAAEAFGLRQCHDCGAVIQVEA